MAGSCDVYGDEFLGVIIFDHNGWFTSCEEDVTTVYPFAGVKSFGSVDFGQELISLAFICCVVDPLVIFDPEKNFSHS